MSNFFLTVTTPERSLVSKVQVSAIVVPSSMGQLTLLPGHINFVTSLAHGTFGYKTDADWQIAFLTGGFAQVFEGNVSVLAETVDMAHEVDVAASELEVQEIGQKLKALKVGQPEYYSLLNQKEFAEARLRAAKEKLH